MGKSGVLLAVATALLLSGCDGDDNPVEGLTPHLGAGIGIFECKVDIKLNLDCSVGRELVIGLGPIKISGGFSADLKPDSPLVLVIRQPDGTSEGWQIGKENRSLCLEQTGNFVGRIGRNLIEIFPQVGASIRVTDPEVTGQDCMGSPAKPSVAPSAPVDVTVVTVTGPTKSVAPPPKPSSALPPQNTLRISSPAGGMVDCNHDLGGTGKPPQGMTIRLIVKSHANGRFYAGPSHDFGLVINTSGAGSWISHSTVFGDANSDGLAYTVYLVVISESTNNDLDVQMQSNQASGWHINDDVPNDGDYDIRHQITVTRTANDNC